VCNCQISSCCPLCQTISFRIHSRCSQTIGDLPVSGKLAKLKLQVRKFFCENSDCTRKIFTERFKEQLDAYSRRFERLNDLILSIGLELGSKVVHRIGKLCYVKISASTILRLVLKCPIPDTQLPKIIGVDDWSFKKRLKYGTIIVDFEKNEMIDLLSNREGKTLTGWLKQFSFIETESSHYLKVKQLQDDGVSKHKIAKILKMSRNNIYWKRTSFLQKLAIKRVIFLILKTISSNEGKQEKNR
jgi:transposase